MSGVRRMYFVAIFMVVVSVIVSGWSWFRRSQFDRAGPGHTCLPSLHSQHWICFRIQIVIITLPGLQSRRGGNSSAEGRDTGMEHLRIWLQSTARIWPFISPTFDKLTRKIGCPRCGRTGTENINIFSGFDLDYNWCEHFNWSFNSRIWRGEISKAKPDNHEGSAINHNILNSCLQFLLFNPPPPPPPSSNISSSAASDWQVLPRSLSSMMKGQSSAI